jgi:hypothetical protein
MSNFWKNELRQISNWLGALVGILGNILPYLTPDFLSGLGLSAQTTHVVSSIVAILLIAYREKPVPFVPNPPEKRP